MAQLYVFQLIYHRFEFGNQHNYLPQVVLAVKEGSANSAGPEPDPYSWQIVVAFARSSTFTPLGTWLRVQLHA